ncbi:TIM barrel protein [Carnobacterium sp. PL12RED10]|uniref:sugar phosphate isomerase/epimerase family protein n=1 Tax=Carnobacterium sp. PL12RED10 TaxID=2592351 RepID=UPI000EEE29E6|nr:TIM barrel protein [Carnobacterium sp. PL12RED10]KAF3300209.1 TIM barrel protein [Carnobacterium sp. PL12RED10]HCT98221.1 AP endonuclease [Aerococcus urinaeequi]
MIGLCSVTFRDDSVDYIIDLAKEAGIQAIEWGSDNHLPKNDIAQAEKVAQLMQEAGLTTSSYGAYYKLGSFEDFEPFIQIAQIVDASIIRVWAGEEGSADVDGEYREDIIEDANRIGKMAAEANLSIALEYHMDTLTDTPSSAQQLMQEITAPNAYLYWQPAESLMVEERIESLPNLAPWITNVHVFHWQDFYNRYPLADGQDEWLQYIRTIEKESQNKHHYLIEFVPGEDQKQGFLDSVATLKAWLYQLNIEY